MAINKVQPKTGTEIETFILDTADDAEDLDTAEETANADVGSVALLPTGSKVYVKGTTWLELTSE